MINIEENLTTVELDTIIESLEFYKTRDIFGEMTSDLFENMIIGKPKQTDPPEFWATYNKRQEDKRLEKAKKATEQKKFSRELDILKSKLILLREAMIKTSLKGLPDPMRRRI